MKKTFKLLPLTAMVLTMCLSSCDKKSDPQPPEKALDNYCYASHSDGSYYATTFSEFPKEGTITSDFSRAVQLLSGHLFMEKYGEYIYFNSGAMGDGNGGEQTLRKYIAGKDNVLREVGTLTFANSPSVVDIVFASESKAYAIAYNTGNLLIFNPSSMKETGKIDLSKYAASGATITMNGPSTATADGNPDAGNGIIVDGKLYLPLNQFNGGMRNFQPFNTDGQVAVIDVATDKVEKVITTPLAQNLGMLGHTTPAVIGNYIYINAGPVASMFGMKNGIVRIDRRTQEFDPSFHVDMTKISGGENGSYAMSMVAGDKCLYFFLYKKSLRVNEDENDYVNNKAYAAYEFNVETQTGRILDLPASSGWSANAMLVEKENVYFGIHSKDGAGFYRYNAKTGKGDKTACVKTPAGIYKVIKIRNK